MTVQPCSDIGAAIEELSQLPGFEHLSKRLTQISDLSACCADLRFASDCLAALDELLASPRGLNRPSRRATETALLMTSINFYVRATAAAKKGERGSSTIVAQLNADERRDHNEIVEVRHRGLTHVTPNAALTGGEVWNEHHPLAFDVGDGWKLAFATRNVAFRVDLFAQMRRQLPVAERILAERFQEKIERLGREVRKAPDWDQILRKHSLDPIDIFGSPEAAARAMGPIASGVTATAFFTLDPVIR